VGSMRRMAETTAATGDDALVASIAVAGEMGSGAVMRTGPVGPAVPVRVAVPEAGPG